MNRRWPEPARSPTTLRRIWLVLQVELAAWRARPLALAGLLLPPVLLGIVLAVLALNVTQEPVALVVEDQGAPARRMAAILAADTDAYTLRVTDAAQARRLAEAQAVAAVITIPAGFSAAARAGHAVVRLDLDNVDIDVADDCRRSLDRSVGAFDGLAIAPDTDDAPGTTDRDGPLASTAPSPYGIAIEEHDLHRTTVGFLPFELASVAAVAALSLALIGTALATAIGRTRGTDRLVQAAAGARVLRSARLLLGAGMGWLSWCCGILVVVLLPESGAVATHLGVVVLAGAVLAVAGAGAGVLLGSWLRPRTLAVVAPALVLGLVFAGGSVAPPSLLPAPARWLAFLDPAGAAVQLAREGLFYQSAIALAPGAVLGAWTVALLGIALLPRRS